MKPLSSTVWMLALAGALGAAAPAQAGVLDVLFGKSQVRGAEAGPPTPSSHRRVWTVREFTEIRLVPRESAAPRNHHPAVYTPEQLRRWMETITFARDGRHEPLFGADELAELPGPLAQALASASPDDDVILLSTSRRDGGVLATPLGLTARLFVQPAGALNLVVHDARLDFYNAYRGSKMLPEFAFGSRERAGAVRLASSAGEGRRGDWLAFRGTPGAPAAADGRLQGGAGAANAGPGGAAVESAGASGAASRAAPAPTPAGGGRDARFYEEQEQRLQALKRLRERDLISEEEYRSKRKEILDAL